MCIRDRLSECGKVEAQIGEKTILSEKIKKAYEIKGEYARCQDALRNMQTCESALKEQQERAPLLKEQSQSVIQDVYKRQVPLEFSQSFSSEG